MKTEPDVLGWLAMLACIVVTAHGEWSLAVACGYVTTVAAGLPIAIDAYAIRAMRAGKEILPPVLLMVATNAAAHLVHGGMLRVTPWLIVLVSAIAPVVLWRVHALRRAEDVHTAERPAEYAERVPVPVGVPPVPEAYPAIETPVPAVPEPVPDGVRLLPIVARPEAPRNEIPEPVLAAEYARARDEVHAEYVPEPPGDGPGRDEDPLTEAGLDWAAERFKTELLAGKVPGIARIKADCHVGQDRAKEIQDAFRQALPQLAGTGATS
ncbi:hypothetical protein [Streptomyces formicae]